MAHAKSESISNHFIRGEIIRRWQELTNSDIEECCADQSKLIDVLRVRYGYAQKRAQKEAELFFGEIRQRLRMTA